MAGTGPELIRPSYLSDLRRCPLRAYHIWETRSIANPVSRAMLKGIVWHEIAEELTRAAWAGEALTPEFVGEVAGRCAGARLTEEEFAELDRAARYFELPCPFPRDQILVIEPCEGHGLDARPIDAWPAWETSSGRKIWGTPDLVFLRLDGRPEIWDWKFSRTPQNPTGPAPAIYAALLHINWERIAAGPFRWPVHVTHRFVMLGRDRGSRTVEVREHDVRRVLAEIGALLKKADAWRESGEWPAVVNEYCATAWSEPCPLYATCPAHSEEGGPPEDEYAFLLQRWYQGYAREQEGRRIRVQAQAALAEAAVGGVTVELPTAEHLITQDVTRVTWDFRGWNDIEFVRGYCDARGLPAHELLTLDGSRARDYGLTAAEELAPFRRETRSVECVRKEW